MNPHQLVPTVRVTSSQAGGAPATVWESNTIVRYLTMRYGPALHGGSAEGLAAASGW